MEELRCATLSEFDDMRLRLRQGDDELERGDEEMSEVDGWIRYEGKGAWKGGNLSTKIKDDLNNNAPD